MDISEIVRRIDKEIGTRKTDNFGIKVGMDLFRELVAVGKIRKARFTVAGTGAFPMDLPAYNGQYFIFDDWEIDDYAFEVGRDP